MPSQKKRKSRVPSRHGFTRASEGESSPRELSVQALTHFERAMHRLLDSDVVAFTREDLARALSPETPAEPIPSVNPEDPTKT